MCWSEAPADQRDQRVDGGGFDGEEGEEGPEDQAAPAAARVGAEGGGGDREIFGPAIRFGPIGRIALTGGVVVRADFARGQLAAISRAASWRR